MPINSALKISDDDSPSEVRSDKRSKQFREKRVEIPVALASIVHFKDFYQKDNEARLANVSRFGARIRMSGTADFLKIGSVLEHLAIKIEGTSVFSGAATVVNERVEPDNGVTYGLVLEGEGIDLDQVDAILGLTKDQNNITSTRQTLDLISSVRPEFKVLVADLNTLFQDLKYKLIQEEQKIASSAVSENHRRRMEEHAITLAISLYTEDFRGIYRQFRNVTRTLNADESAIHKRYFRANFLPVTLGTPFMARAFTKPLGYAGDFGLMVMFYEYEDTGKTLFDKFKHRYACNEPAAVANKNRVELLSDMLGALFDNRTNRNENFKVASVACGPAKEVELFLREIKEDHGPIEVICLDQDARAIEYAQKQIRSVASRRRNIKSVFLTEDAVLGLIREKEFTNYLRSCNVIVSAGLFDYLSDRVATKLISALYEYLVPGGTLLIGNVSDKNPDQFSMDYYMEWNLILRNEDDLRNLVSEEIRASGASVDTISESLGLNLFLRVQKPSKG